MISDHKEFERLEYYRWLDENAAIARAVQRQSIAVRTLREVGLSCVRAR